MIFNSVKKRIISFLLAIAVFLSGINFPNIASLAEQETVETEGDTPALVWVDEDTEASAEPEEPSAASEEGSAVSEEDGSGSELPGSEEETAAASEEEMTEDSGEVSEEETEAVSEEETAVSEEETTEVAEETTAAAEEETTAAAEEETTAAAEEETTAAVEEETTAAAEEETAASDEEETVDDPEDEPGDTPEEETDPDSEVTGDREKTGREDLETDNFTGLTAEKEVILENLDTHYVTVSDALTAVDDVCLDITVADPGLIETENLEAEEAGEDIFVLAHSESTLRFYAGSEEDAYYVAALNPYVEVAPASLSLTHKEEHDTVYDSSSLIYDAVTGLVYLKKSLADAHYQQLRLSVYYLVTEDEEPVDAAEAFITSFLTDDSVVEPGDPVAVSGNLTDETVVLDLYEYLRDGLNESMLTVYVNGYSEPLTEEEFSYGNAMLTVNLTPFAVRDLVVEVNTGDETLGRENLADVEREITGEQEILTENGELPDYWGDVPPVNAPLPENAWTETQMRNDIGIYYYIVQPAAGDPFYNEYPDANGYVVLGRQGAAEQDPEVALQSWYGYYNGTNMNVHIRPYVALWNDDIGEDGDWEYYPVYKVGAYCFSTSATTVPAMTMTLPDTIAEIEDNAFNGCWIPFSEDGYGRCNIPAGVKKIGNNAFMNAVNVGEIRIKGQNVSIGDHAFDGCLHLYSVAGNPDETDPEKMNLNSWASEIGAYAFRGTNIGADGNPFVIPGSVNSIAESAFAGMNRLHGITFDTGSQELTIPANVFSGEDASSTPMEDVTAKRGSLSIADNAFKGISGLRSLNLADDENGSIYPYVRSIGANAFQGTALQTLTLPAGIESIGESAFDGIHTLASFTVEAADEHHAAAENLAVGKNAFHQAFNQNTHTSSIEINVPAVLGESAFAGNPGIGSLELNSTDIAVRDSAFASVGSSNYPLGTAETPLDLSGVVSFGASAFAGSQIGYMTLPDTLDCDDKLGVNAFKNASLQTVEIPSGWTGTLPSGLFADNAGLAAVTFAAVPDGGADSGLSLADVGAGFVSPFAGCSSLAEFKDYRKGTIGDSAFAGCTSLNKAEIPYVTAVGDFTFSGCTGIGALRMESVTEIGEKAFYQTGAAAEVDPAQVSISLSTAAVIGKNAFAESKLISGIVGNSGSNPLTVELPAPGSACSIGAFAFSKTAAEAVNISGINIPEGMFKDCTELTGLTLASADIGASAFSGCTGLTVLDLTVGTIGNNAFSGCTGITDLTLAAASIGDSVFTGCSNLASAVLTLTGSIGASAFAGCAKLSALTIHSVQDIGASAFSGCTALTTLAFTANNIGDYAFESCSGLTSVRITGNNIGQYAFTGCTGEFTADITLTGDVGSSAFSKCSAKNLGSAGITSLKLKADTVGNAAFNKCLKLASAELDVQQVSKFAFLDCSKLASLSMTPAVVGESAFKNCGVSVTNPLPSEAIDLSGTGSIGASAFEGCKLLGVVVLSQDPQMTMDLLGGAAFKGSSVSSVTLPVNQPASMPEVKPDGTYYGGIFEGCVSLTDITIPGGWTCVPRSMFMGCSGLETVTFANGTEAIEIRPYAFYGTKIASLNISRPGTIGESAFTGCGYLSSVQIPRVTAVGDHAFDSLTGLNKLDLGSGLGEGETLAIGAYAFRNAGSAEGLVINDEDLHIDLTQISSVGDYAFSGCKLIRGNVTLLGNIIVGNYAFANSEFENLTVDGAQITNASVFSGASFGSLTVTDSAKLGASSFEGASMSGDVAISDSSIGAYAFKNAQIVGNVTVSNPSLAAYAFTGASFGDLTVNAPAEGVTTIGADAFASEASEASEETLITTFKRLTVTGTGTVIGDRAFSGVCFSGAVYEEGEEQAEIKITGTDVSIGANAFSGSTGLKVADVHGAGSIGKSAFAGCAELTAVNAGGAGSIGASTFSGCGSLTAVDIQNALTIGNSAFLGCTALTEIDARKAESIGKDTFRNLTNLQNVNIHAAVTVGESAFEGCSGITVLDMASVKTVEKKAFKNAGAASGEISVTNAAGAGSSIDPSSIESIGEEAFFACKLIKGNVELDLAKTTLGKKAFAETVFGDLKLNNSPAENETEPAERTLADGVFADAQFGALEIAGSRIKVGEDVFNGAAFRSALISGNNNTLQQHALSGAVISDTALTPANGIITITGSGNTIGSYVGAAHGSAAALQFNALVINGPGSGTVIAENAFKAAVFNTLTIGGTNTEIGEAAFKEANFDSAVISGSGTEIGTDAFRSADFDTLIISTSSVTIGDFAFAESEISTLKLPYTEPGSVETVAVDGVEKTVNTALGSYIFMGCPKLTTDLTSETGFAIQNGNAGYFSGENFISLGNYTSGVGYNGLEGLLLDGVIPNRYDRSEINSSGSIVPAGWTYLPEGFFYNCNGIRFLYLKNVTEVADYVYCTKGYCPPSIAASSIAEYDHDSPDNRLCHTVVWFSKYLAPNAISEHAFQKENKDLYPGMKDSTPSYIEIYLKQNPYGTVDGYRKGWGSVDSTKYWIRWKEWINEFGPEDIFSEPRIAYNRNGGEAGPDTVISSLGDVDIVIYNYLGYHIADPEAVAGGAYEDQLKGTALPAPLTESEGDYYYLGLNLPGAYDPEADSTKPAGFYTTGLVVANYGPNGVIDEEHENDPVYFSKYYETIRLVRTNEDPIDEFDYRYALFRHPYYDETGAYTYLQERELNASDRKPIPGYWYAPGYQYNDLGMDWARFIEVLGAEGKDRALGFAESTPEINTINTIGDEAFKVENDDEKFTSIWIPVSITGIGEGAFRNQTLLGSNPELPGYGVPNLNVCSLSVGIGNDAFSGCASLPEVHLNTVGNIGQKAFENCSGLTLFETGTAGTVGTYAFTGCSSLKTVRFTGTGTSVADIGAHAFDGCGSLEEVTAAGSAGSIGTSAFRNCGSLKTVNFGSTVAGIGNNAFENCSHLETFTAEGTVGNIGSQAFIRSFVNCGGHGTVMFKAGAGNIGDYAFSGCSGLEKVTAGYVNGSNEFVAAGIGSIGEYAFSECGTSASPCGSLKEFRAANTGNIGKGAFLYCGSLESFTVMNAGISGNIGAIGTYAFGHCGKLREFKADSVGSIGNAAFEYCFSDAAYAPQPGRPGCQVEIGTISGSGICINDQAFVGCRYLTDVTIGTIGSAGNPGSIGNGAFYNCTALGNFTIGTAETYGPVADLGGQDNAIGAFEGCGALKNVNVSSIDNIGAYAFHGCASLGSVNADGRTEFAIRSFSGDSEGKGLVGKYAFTGCDFEVFKVDSGTVRKFDDYAFAAGPAGRANVGACELLKKVQISKVLSIQQGVFQACVSLTEIDIDEIGTVGGTAIGASAFEQCDALTAVTLKKVNGTIGQRAFAECDELASFKILAGTISKLGGDAVAGETGSIFYHCPLLTSIEFGVLTTPDAVSCEVQQISKNAFRGQNVLQDVYFEKIGTVGETAFYGCGNLRNVDLDEVGTIGANAFENSGNSLTSTEPGMKVDIAKVDTIGTKAFYNCRKLTSVQAGFYAVNNAVNGSAFCGCEALKEAVLNGVKSIGENAFQNTGTVYNDDVWTGENAYPGMQIPETLKTIGDCAFDNCRLFTAVDLNAKTDGSNVVTSVGNYAFRGCTNITSVTLPDTLPGTFGINVFENCTSLPQAVIPNEWEKAPQGIFKGCSKLKALTLPSSLRTIEIEAFRSTASAISNGETIQGITWADGGGWWQIVTVGESAFNTSKLVGAVDFQGSGAGTSRTQRMSSIGETAFAGSSVTSLILPDEEPLELCADHSDSASRKDQFKDCKSLTGLITIPAGWDCVSEGMFSGANPGTLRVTGQEGTKLTIRKNAFSGCALLDDITINGLTDIEAGTTETTGAFYQCGTGSSVTSVKLVIDAHPADYSAAVESTPMGTVSEYAFSGCTRLSDVALNYVDVKANAFKNCFSSDCLEGLTNKVTVRENAKFTGAVFESCSRLDQVTVKKAAFTSNAEADSAVFHNCGRLDQVKVTEAADFTGTLFTGCSKLKKILVSPGIANRANATRFIGNNIDSIGILTGAGASWGGETGIELVINGEAQICNYAFANSPKLYSVTMNDVTKMGDSGTGVYAFYNSGIVNLSVNKLQSVPKAAFRKNPKLRSIELPQCQTIGESAFQEDTALTSVIADACTKIDRYAFRSDAGLVTVSADAVTQIAEEAFRDCSSLVGKTVPGENYTALYFPALKTLGSKPSASDDLKVNEGKWTIERYASCSSGSFENCTALQRVEMPVIEIIGQDAFRNCTDLDFFNKTEAQTIHDRNNKPIYNEGRDLYYHEEGDGGEGEIHLDMSELPRTLHYLGANAFDGTAMYSVYVIPNWPMNSAGTQQKWWSEAGEAAVSLSDGGEEKWTGKPFFAQNAFEGLGLNAADSPTPYVFVQMDHNSIQGCPWTTATEISVDWHDCIMYDRNSNLWYKYNDTAAGESGVVSIIENGSREDTAYVIPDSLPDGMGRQRPVKKIGSGSTGESSVSFFTNCFIFAVNDENFVRVVLNDHITEIVDGALNTVDDIQIPQYPEDGPLTEEDILKAMLPAGQLLPEDEAALDEMRNRIVWLEKPVLDLDFLKRLVGTSEITSEDTFVFRMAYDHGSDYIPSNYEYSSANPNGFRTQTVQISTAEDDAWSETFTVNETEARQAVIRFAPMQYERGNRGSDGLYDGKYIAAAPRMENGARIYDPDTNNGQVYVYWITELESEGGDYEYFSNISEVPEGEVKKRYIKVTFTRETDPSDMNFSINYTAQAVWYSDDRCTQENETDNVIENTYYAPVTLIYNLNPDAIPGYNAAFEEGMLETVSVSYAQPAVIQRGAPAVVNAQNERDYSKYVFAGWSTRREPSNLYAKRFTAGEELLKPERTEIGKVRYISDQGEECGYAIANNVMTLYAIWKKVENQPIYTRYGSDVLYNEDGTVMSSIAKPARYGYSFGTRDVTGFGFRLENSSVNRDYRVIDDSGKLNPNLPVKKNNGSFDPDKYENDFLIYVDNKWRWGLKKEAGITDPGKSGKALKAYWTRDRAKLAKLVLKREVTVDGERSWATVGEINGKAGYVAYNNPYVYYLNADEYDGFDIEQTAGNADGTFFTDAIPANATNGTGAFLGWYTAAEGGTKILNPDGTFAMEESVSEIPGWVIRKDGTVRWLIANTVENEDELPTERVLYAHFGNE